MLRPPDLATDKRGQTNLYSKKPEDGCRYCSCQGNAGNGLHRRMGLDSPSGPPDKDDERGQPIEMRRYYQAESQDRAGYSDQMQADFPTYELRDEEREDDCADHARIRSQHLVGYTEDEEQDERGYRAADRKKERNKPLLPCADIMIRKSAFKDAAANEQDRSNGYA